MILSIIVPVSNTEKYLRECLDSILNQTMTDFELILVDDGSKDASGEICDEYAGKDGRIKVIHKKNEGACMARKAGVEAAGGKFVAFVDSDDWIEPQMYEKLMEGVCANNADIVTSGVCYSESGIRNVDIFPEGIYSGKRIEELQSKIIFDGKLIRNGILCSVWTKIYRRSLLLEALKALDTSISVWEDLAYVYPPFFKASVIQITHEIFYHYRENINSITHKYNSNLLQDTENSYYEIKRIYSNYGELYCKQVIQLFVYQIYVLINNEFEPHIANKDSFAIRKERVRRICQCSLWKEIIESEVYSEMKLPLAQQKLFKRLKKGHVLWGYVDYRMWDIVDKLIISMKKLIKKIISPSILHKVKKTVS